MPTKAITLPRIGSTVLATKAIRLPNIGSILISGGPGSDGCGLCGNSFDIKESSESTRIEYPCVDIHCEPCARMWRILTSPICPACYADFTCPKVATDCMQISLPQLDLDAKDTAIVQQQPPPDSPIELPISFKDKYIELRGVSADLDSDSISKPGSPMREGDDASESVKEISAKDFRDALVQAKNRAGTNFESQEIESETSLADLRTGTKTQRADKLWQFSIAQASENDEDDVGDETSQQLDDDDSDNAISHQDEETAQRNGFRCIYCTKIFNSADHLRQHMVVHSSDQRTCSICGRVLGNSNSRAIHEKKHCETERERNERLQKGKEARDTARARRVAQQQKRRQRASKS